MKLLKALLALTVSTVCSYAATKYGALEVSKHIEQRSASVQPEITREEEATAFSLAYINDVCDDLSVASKATPDELYVKLNTALQLLMMISKTHLYDTTAIIDVAERIKNDWHSGEDEKSEWAERLRISSRALDDNLSINLKNITTAHVHIEDVAKYLQGDSKLLVSSRKDWVANKLDSVVLLLQSMDYVDHQRADVIELVTWIKDEIIKDIYFGIGRRNDLIKKLYDIIFYLGNQLIFKK